MPTIWRRGSRGEGQVRASGDVERAMAKTKVRPNDLLTRGSGWGLLSDAARLLRHTAPERYLVLIALDPDTSSSDFEQQKVRHDYMMNMSFCPDAAKEETRRYDGFAARVWSIRSGHGTQSWPAT